MNTQERTLPIAVVILVAIAIAVAAIFAAAVALPGNQAEGASVTPDFLEGPNAGIKCSDLVGSGQTWTELKFEDPDLKNGSLTEGALTVTISNLGEDTFDWSSNIGVDAVFVKGGNEGSNLYVYDPPTESTGDDDLAIPNPSNNGISHISFCFDEEDATPTPTPGTTPTPTPTPTPGAEASPTPTPTALAEVQEPEALPASGGAPADGSGLGILPWLLGLGGLALLSGAGTLVAVKVRRQR